MKGSNPVHNKENGKQRGMAIGLKINFETAGGERVAIRMHEAMTKIEARALLVGHGGKANALWLLSGLLLLVPGLLTPLVRLLLAQPAVQAALQGAGGAGTAHILIFALSLLALVACVLLAAPLKAGRMAWFWRQSGRKGRRNGVGTLFCAFRPARRAMRAAGLWLALFIRKLGWGLLFCGPGLLLLGIAGYRLLHGSEALLFLIPCAAGGVFLIAGLIFYLVVTRRYLLAYYLFDESGKAAAPAVIRESARVMDGQMGRAAAFALSFAPWILSCVFLFPVFYVYPYYQQSRASFARQALSLAPRSVARDAEN